MNNYDRITNSLNKLFILLFLEKGSDLGKATHKSSEILGQDTSSRPGTPAAGDNEATKPTTTNEAGGKIDRKLSFSSILNRNSESYKQSRFRRAASISFIPKEANNMERKEQGQFESRVRIPCRRRPKSFHSFEYEKFKSTTWLPSTAEDSEDSRDQLKIRRAESLKRICELENVVDRAAAWLAESKSFIQKQYFPMPNESTKLNTCCEEDVESIESCSNDGSKLKRSHDIRESKRGRGLGLENKPCVLIRGIDVLPGNIKQGNTVVEDLPSDTTAAKANFEVEENWHLDVKGSVGSNEERNDVKNDIDVEYGIVVEGIYEQVPEMSPAENEYDEKDGFGGIESFHGTSNRIMEKEMVVGDMNYVEQSEPVMGSCKETDLDEYAVMASEFVEKTEKDFTERNRTGTMELSSEKHLHSIEGTSSNSDFVNNKGSKRLVGDYFASELIPNYIHEMENAAEDIGPIEMPCDDSNNSNDSKNFTDMEESTKDPSYIPAIRELLQDIQSRRGSTNSEEIIFESKSIDLEENQILSPRQNGAHENPFEELTKNGRIDAQKLERETRVFDFQSAQEMCGREESEYFERKDVDLSNQQAKKSAHSADKQHQADHNSLNIDKYKQTEDIHREYTETTTRSESCTGDNLPCLEGREVWLADIPLRQIPDKGCNGNPIGRELGNVARADSDITSENVPGDGRRKLSRRPFSTSDLGRRSLKVKLTEIHYLPSLKKSRRKRPTSASNLQLEWDSSINLKEINVDEYSNNETSQIPRGEVDGLMANTDSNIESNQTRNSVDDSEVVTKAELPKDSMLSIEIPNDSLDKQSSCIQNHGFDENGSFDGILKIDSRQRVDEICGESGNMIGESRFTESCLEIKPNDVHEDGALQSNGIEAEIVVVEEDEITEKLIQLDQLSNEKDPGVSLRQSGKVMEDRSVEAIMINKTDDWKTENFHKIRSKTNTEGTYDVEDGVSRNKTKEDSSKANQGHGSAWFKDKAEKSKRKMLKQISEEGYKNRANHEVAGRAAQRRVSDGFGFIRNKFQKFAKWSKRGSVDSSEISEPKIAESLLGHSRQQSAQEIQMEENEGDLNNDISHKEVVSNDRQILSSEEPNSDVNQNVMASTDFTKNLKANRGKRRLKFDDVANNAKDGQPKVKEVSYRKTLKKYDTSKVKEIIVDKNKREERMKARTAKIIHALKREDEVSLTTVSALSTTNQPGLPLLKDLDDCSSISSSDSGDASDFNHHSSDSSLSGRHLYSSGRSSSSDTINESVDESQMPDFRSPSRIQDDLAGELYCFSTSSDTSYLFSSIFIDT